MTTLQSRLQEYQCFEHCPGCECEVTKEADKRFEGEFAATIATDLKGMLRKEIDCAWGCKSYDTYGVCNCRVSKIEAALDRYCGLTKEDS